MSALTRAELAALLSDLCQDSGLTMGDAADQAGLSRSGLHKILTGGCSPTLDTVTRLGVAWGYENIWSYLADLAAPVGSELLD